MDNDLTLGDVINCSDPVALNQFLDFPVYGSAESHSLEEIVPVTTEEDFLNFESCGLGYSSVVSSATDATEWNFEPSAVSAVGAPTADSGPVVSLPQRLAAVSQNLPVGCVSALPSQSFIQIQPSRSNVNDVKQLLGNAESSIQRFPNANRIMTNFAVGTSVSSGSGSANGGQVLVNVQPQTVVPNNAVRIQYIRVQNQLPGAVPTGTVVQNFGAIQLPMNSFKNLPLQQQGQQLVAHGVQGGMNLQGAIMPTSAGNHIVIRTGNQTSSNVSAGQVSMQPAQIGSSNFVGGGMQVTSIQQGVRLQQPQVTTYVNRTNAVTGQVIDASTGLSGGRHIVLQRTPGVASQNLVVQQMPQQQHQHPVTLPVDATTGSQDNKHSDGLVVQIGGQTYRLEPSHQPLGGAANVRQNSVFPPSQSVRFGDGSGAGVVSHDPVKMLKQNVQLQQMLIGNQINVLQILQKQQQQQQQCLQQPMFAVQQFGAGSSGTNSTEATGGSSGTVLHPQPLQAPNTLEKAPSDPSHWGLRPSVTIAPTPQSGLQFIQPKPVASAGIPPSSGIVSQPPNMLPLVPLGAQPTVSSANRNIVGVNVQSSAQVVTTLSGMIPQSVKGVAGGQTSQSQTVTTVKLSTEQQNLLFKIQSQMKTLLDLSVRNPDQEKYLQMLINGQQRIIGQGVSQYLQQQKTTGVKVVSGGSLQQQSVQPTTSVLNGSLLQISSGNSAANMSTAVTTFVSSRSSMSTSLTSNLQNTGQIKAEDIFQTMPHLKEKIEAHMSKMSPEQRQWFAKNQSTVFARLQQHHRRLLLERDRNDQPPEQHLKPLAPVQLKDSPEVNPSSEGAATRVIRSLHLTRAQKFHLYLQKDQKRTTQPEYSKTFDNFKDVIRGLVPYHIFQTRDPSDEEITTVEETFEEKVRELLERKDGMLRKYRQLLMEESMRPQLTSEMVLLERTFHSDEKALLLNEKRQAEEDPDSFIPKPVVKRMKLEDGDVKKEDDSIDSKDEDMAAGEEVSESAASLPDENVVKLESRSCPSSPTNNHLLSTSFERLGGLRIKLEKLDDLDNGLTESQYKISTFDSSPARDDENLEDERTKSFEIAGMSQIPANTSSSSEGFTEDDMAVASLLNTESFNITGCNFDRRSAGKVVNNDTEASEECTAVSSTLANSSDAYFSNSLFTSTPDTDAGEISSEPETNDLMQGTIDSLMADLTQFNYDLSSSWPANDAKAEDSGSRPTTVQNTLAKQDSSAAEGSECTLQYEMQCAIDSIMQLQQPWSDGVGTMSDLLTSSTVEREASLQNWCLDKC